MPTVAGSSAQRSRRWSLREGGGPRGSRHPVASGRVVRPRVPGAGRSGGRGPRSTPRDGPGATRYAHLGRRRSIRTLRRSRGARINRTPRSGRPPVDSAAGAFAVVALTSHPADPHQVRPTAHSASCVSVYRPAARAHAKRRSAGTGCNGRAASLSRRAMRGGGLPARDAVPLLARFAIPLARALEYRTRCAESTSATGSRSRIPIAAS